jgi:C4-dicarboxylate transporter, DctQ subunit
MHQALTQAAKWFDRLNRTLAAIACILLVLITLAICAEIVTRWLFNFSNIWLIELSEITLLYVTFLGAAWVLGNDGHVTLDVLLNLMSPDGRRRLHFVLSIVGAIACFMLVWFGILVMVDQFQNDIREPTIMAPQTFWITSVIPFGSLLLGIQFLRRAVRSALGLTLRVNSG